MATPDSQPRRGGDVHLHDDDAEHRETGTEVRAEPPEDDGEAKRQGEAGNAYVGREMDDRLKANPRIEDADQVRPEDEEGQ